MQADAANGVFETMLVARGKAVDLDAHLERLRLTVGEVYAVELDASLEERVRERAASTVEPSRLRIDFDPLTRAATIAVVAAPDCLLAVREHPPATLRKLAVPGGFGEHKWRDRAVFGEGGAVLVDEHDVVLEATHANVFAVEGRALVTPPLDGRILPGTTRARVIALARDRSIDVDEAPLAATRAAAADDLFLTSSVRGLQRVAACTGIGAWSPSAVSDELRDALLAALLDELA